jgi:hypothetical protein
MSCCIAAVGVERGWRTFNTLRTPPIAAVPCISDDKDRLIESLKSVKEDFGLDRPGVPADNMGCGLKVLSVPLSSLAA